MRETPFDETLFLDTDTYINSDLTGLFQLLNSYDLGIAHDPSYNTHLLSSVPESFPEYNTGVLLYDNNSEVDELMKAWNDYYDQMDDEHNSKDQPAFRRALYHSEVDYITLTREWNCFYNFPGYIAEPPKILHGRIPSPKRAARIHNDSGIYRRTWFRLQSMQSKTYFPGYLKMVLTSIEENGIRETYHKIKSSVLD